MKVTYIEELEYKTALDRNKYCPNCGSHMYIIHHQLKPETSSAWWLECESCGFESFASPSRDIAITRWKQRKLPRVKDR